MKNLLIIFRPICWLTEVYYQFRYLQIISGHDYVEQDDGTLRCEVCGKKS